MQPDKIADGLFEFLAAGAAGPALREVCRYFRRASRRQLAIRCQQKFFIREMRFGQHSSLRFLYRSSARIKRARDRANEMDTAPRDKSRT